MGPNSVTMASLVDCILEAKRTLIQLPEPPHEYHSLCIHADELSAFMPLYEPELIGGLTTFYDCVPYAQHRRGKDIRIKIDSPQLNILSGSTPSNLLKFVPDYAWDQGFMSRVIMIYSGERPLINIFAKSNIDLPQEMVHDLKQISGLHGEFQWSESYATQIHNWRSTGERPTPTHPKLANYNSRRLGHVLKLSMVSAIDRGNLLRLEAMDFERGLNWLVEAESHMSTIFQTGQVNTDSQAMDEVIAYCNGHDIMRESVLMRELRRKVNSLTCRTLLENMVKMEFLIPIKVDPVTQSRTFKVVKENARNPVHAEVHHTTESVEKSAPASKPSPPSVRRPG